MAHSLLIENLTPTDNPAGGLRLGLVRAEGVQPDRYPEGLEEALATAIASSAGERLDARRAAARDMLRNGRYKPTGRGKPASEYLARAASEGTFPRINALVDINNLISLQEALPISLWDLDRVAADHVRFRLGREGEAYVFNPSGQTLGVEDLVVGCRVTEGGEEPVVSPIKDAQVAKTTSDTRRVAACIYAPINIVSEGELEAICTAFADWLAGCGEGVQTASAVAGPGVQVRL